jgi:hypothetical protein
MCLRADLHGTTISFPITRRAALGAGAAFIAMAPRPGWSTVPSRHKIAAKLFAFVGPETGNLVLAVTFASGARNFLDESLDAAVRINSNRGSWTVHGRSGVQSPGSPYGQNYLRSFAGQVVRMDSRPDEIYNAVVVETAPDLLPPGGHLKVWAELLADGQSRLRVGSPIVAKLLAHDSRLSAAYHAVSPEDDVTLLSDLVGRRIAFLAKAYGTVPDPTRYARRLSAHLLPDVIRYSRDLPVGFNFVGQNGLHPADDTAAVVATILTGAPIPRGPEHSFELTKKFPYFLDSNRGTANLPGTARAWRA